MSTHELTWSSFLREPTSVERWLARGDVVLRRRDGESLRLSREAGTSARNDGLQTAAKLLSVGASKAREALKDEDQAIAQRLPWTRFLSAAERREFASELLDTLEACADLGDFTALGTLVEDWKTTATLHAEGLGKKLQGPLREVGGRVRRP